jgi:3-keto-5-aminohexanoate cleavage enzyme
MSGIDWDRVERGLERERHRMIWRPYGLPEVVDPERSAFFDGIVQPPWDMPERLIVSVAITGAFFTRRANAAQPITVQEISSQARACAAAGASTIHLHVRDDRGYNTLSLDRFREAIEPLRHEFSELAVDGCLVPALEGEWEQMKQVLDARLLDGVPINTTAVYLGDALFAKPIPIILEKTRLVQESGAKALIACYSDADVGNANRYLLKSGLVQRPACWLILPALPGCSPMENPRQMFDGLLRISSAIFDADPGATVLVCAAGRATIYLTAVAMALGLHVRVGMEDTIWLWPHRQERIASNLQMLEMTKQLAAALGRDIASHADYRRLVGLPVTADAPSA